MSRASQAERLRLIAYFFLLVDEALEHGTVELIAARLTAAEVSIVGLKTGGAFQRACSMWLDRVVRLATFQNEVRSLRAALSTRRGFRRAGRDV